MGLYRSTALYWWERFSSVCDTSAYRSVYKSWNADVSRPENFDRLYYYDEGENAVIPVVAETLEEQRYCILTEDGDLLEHSGRKTATVIFKKNKSFSHLKSGNDIPGFFCYG